MGEEGAADVHLGLLDRCLLFQALEPAARHQLAERAYRASYDAGAPIFHLGDPVVS